MSLLTPLSFVFFTALVGVITYFLTRGDRHDTSDGYFLAGRTLTGGYIAGSLMLTNLSTEQLVGLNGAAFSDGICVMAWEVIAACSLVVMGLYFLPKYLKSGIATVPEFLEKRFDERTRTITSLIFIVAYAGILLPIILYTGATGLNGILDMKALTGLQNETATLWFTVWLIGIIGSLYAIFGGLRTVAVSDTINGFGLLVGGILIAYLGLQAVNPEGPVAALETLRESHPEKFNSLGGKEQSVPFSTLFTGVLLLNLFYWSTNQQIIQRTFGASSLREGQKGVLLAGSLKVLAPMILVLPGIIAFHLYGRIQLDGQMLPVHDVTDKEVAFVTRGDEGKPEIYHGDDAADLVEAESLTSVGARKYVGTSVKKDGKELQIENVLEQGLVVTLQDGGEIETHAGLISDDYIAPRIRDRGYGLLVKKVLPGPLAGFFAAVMVGAILSSFNSALNSTATLFSLGVYQHMLHPDASEKRVIWAGKVFGCVIAVAAMTVAPLLAGQDSIFGYLQKMNGLYFIPIFSVMLIGLTTRRVPAAAANVALIVGFAAISIGYFVPAAAEWLGDNIHDFHFLGAVFASLIVMMLWFGQVCPRETPWEHKDAGAVDLTPWPLAKPFGAALVLFVLGVYVYFADTSVLGL